MDNYYQLLDANSANVSSLWKVIHVAAMLFATISGFISAYTLGKAIDAFNNHCILFAHIVFYDNTTMPKLNDAMRELPDYFHGINMPETDWGTLSECYFCQFTPVMSMISGLIWGAFFIICSKGGAGYISDSIYRPWRIVYPAIVFAVITIGLLLLSTLELSSGISTFCAQFKDIFNTTECTNYIDEYTLLFSDTQKPLIIFLQMSHIASIICLVCWISQLITLILRIVCVADFEMFKITVTFLNDSQESLQGIIDPDNISFLDDNMSSTSRISIQSRKSYFKHRFPKISALSFLKKFYKFKRTSSSDQSDMDSIDVISLNEPSTSSKFDNDKTSTMESNKSSISEDVVSIRSHDKEAKAKRVGIIEKRDENTFYEETGYSSLFFARKAKYAKKVADSVIRESLSFVPHSDESLLPNVLHSNQNQNNANSLENQIEIDNSDDDLKIVLESDSQYNYLSKNNNLMNLSQESNYLPIQLIGYEQNRYTPYGENIDEEIIIDIIDGNSKENFVMSPNLTPTRPNYEYISNLIQHGHGNVIRVNEEIRAPGTSSPILSNTENAPQPVVVMPSNETKNSNNYIHDSNTTLGLTRNKHRTGHSQSMPYNLPRTIEENEEIPPHEFREEPRNETNNLQDNNIQDNNIQDGTNTAEESPNNIRDLLIRIYAVLWFTVVLRNISSLI